MTLFLTFRSPCVLHLQGLGADKKQDAVFGSAENIAEFLRRSTADPHRSDDVLKSAIGLVGDMVYQ